MRWRIKGTGDRGKSVLIPELRGSSRWEMTVMAHRGFLADISRFQAGLKLEHPILQNAKFHLKTEGELGTIAE